MLQSLNNVGDASPDVINGGCHGDGDGTGEPRNSVGDALGLGVASPYCVAPI